MTQIPQNISWKTYPISIINKDVERNKVYTIQDYRNKIEKMRANNIPDASNSLLSAVRAVESITPQTTAAEILSNTDIPKLSAVYEQAQLQELRRRDQEALQWGDLVVAVKVTGYALVGVVVTGMAVRSIKGLSQWQKI